MQIIEKYFPHLHPGQIEQFSRLGSLYSYWNERINVISRKDIGNLYERHVLHSLVLSDVISFKPATRIIDAGTGGGFPGIPLAILFPETNFILVDSIAKKIRVAEAISREIGLTNCEVRCMRIEDLTDKADFVVFRAVSNLLTIYGWVKKNITPGGFNVIPNGMFAYKGGEIDEEINPLGRGVRVYNLKDYFTEDFFVTKKLIYIPR